MFSGITLFDSLTQGEKDSLALFCQERLLAPGEILFREGDEATALYIVKQGSLEAIQNRSDGSRILGRISVDEIVGEFALFDE
jgi:CRP-like cAMP-binding protein